MIEQNAWKTVEDYPREGEAQDAETVHGSKRLIGRRRLIPLALEPPTDPRPAPRPSRPTPREVVTTLNAPARLIRAKWHSDRC